MKLKKLVKYSLATALVFGSVASITGCKKDGNGINLTKILDKNIINKNNEAIDEDSKTIEYISHNNSILDNTEIIDNYSNYGLLVLKNRLNFVGFYSLHYQKYLLEPQNQNDLTNYDIYTDENVGYFIKTNRTGTYTIYDSLGNEIYESTNNIEINSSIEINNEIYITIVERAYSSTTTSYYKYVNDGNLEKVDSLPTPNIATEEENNSSLDFGDFYIPDEKISLKEYGVKGRYLIKTNNTYSVLNLNNKIIKSFSIPNNVQNVYLIGNSLIYQTFVVDSLNPEVANQTLSKTYAINLESLETKELNLSYIVLGVTPTKDEKDLYKYGLARILKINDGKFEIEPSTVLINEKGKILEDLTKYSNPEAFVKIGQNYYNNATKIIYDSKLNVITHIENINPTLIEEAEVFIGEEKGKYGALDYNGKVVIPFIYDSLQPLDDEINFKDGYIIGKIDSDYYRINKADGTSTKLGQNIRKIHEDLYIALDEENNKIEFISQKETYRTFTNSDIDLEDIIRNPISTKMTMNPLLGEYVITEIQTSDNKNHYIVHSIKDLTNAPTFETIRVGTSGLYQNGERVMSWYELTEKYPKAFSNDGKIIANYPSPGTFNSSYLASLEGDFIIDNSITKIETGAFLNCHNLISITIPDSVISIYGNEFSRCHNLVNIIVSNTNPNYSSENGVLFNKSKTTLIAYPCNKADTIYTIPNSVTTIGETAFNKCKNLTSVIITSNVNTIELLAFSNCDNLNSITIPSNIITILGSTFIDCDNLKTIYLDTNLRNLNYSNIFDNATTIYIKSNLSIDELTELTNNFTKQTTSNQSDYDMYVRNAE